VSMSLPRILIIDDLFGRTCTGPLNPQRADLCAALRLLDVTNDHGPSTAPPTYPEPLAQVQFCRGQAPARARVGATVVNDLAGTLEVVRRGWNGIGAGLSGPWSLVLVDLCFTTGLVTAESTHLLEGMPEGQIADDDPSQYFGLGVVAALRREFPQLPVLILSSRPRHEVSYQFAESGAVGFIDRNAPDAVDRLREALWLHGLLQDHSGALVGRSINFLAALCRARRAALTRQHVLIVGERGTGKELLARYVHGVESAEDPRRRLPFIAVNSAVLSSSLFASELFGIKANTATGVEAREGLIASASTGNLFLDEIGDMPPEIQAALLRVLEDRQVVAVGARTPSAVDVRFLSATNADLGSRTSPLRLDLLDRLRAGGLIALPPLRERRDDIPLLVTSFLREAEALHAARARDVTPDALEMLAGHDWPGNVRDLRSCVLEAVREYRDVEHLVPAHLFIALPSTRVPMPSNRRRMPRTIPYQA
jgi:DNA-binding NtrC family response regulator